MQTNVRNGQEVFRSEPDVIQEIDVHSDEQHFSDVKRFWTHVDSKLPTNGIVKNLEKQVAGYVRMGGN